MVTGTLSSNRGRMKGKSEDQAARGEDYAMAEKEVLALAGLKKWNRVGISENG